MSTVKYAFFIYSFIFYHIIYDIIMKNIYFYFTFSDYHLFRSIAEGLAEQKATFEYWICWLFCINCIEGLNYHPVYLDLTEENLNVTRMSKLSNRTKLAVSFLEKLKNVNLH